MSVDDLLQRVRANGHEVWTAGPQSEAAIVTLEQKLRVRLPPSYRAFLARFGGMAIGDSVVSGICDDAPLTEEAGWAYGDTLLLRDEFKLPGHFLVIQPNEDAPYCLDLRQPDTQGEFPVVCYELHSGHERRIADGFERWLRDWYFAPWTADA